jgi:hypothetical protein
MVFLRSNKGCQVEYQRIPPKVKKTKAKSFNPSLYTQILKPGRGYK